MTTEEEFAEIKHRLSELEQLVLELKEKFDFFLDDEDSEEWKP